MKYTISPDKNTLTLEADDLERAELAAVLEYHGHFSEQDEAKALEELIANSELDWINPADTGDLTEAPLLGIKGADRPESAKPHFPEAIGWTYVGRWENEDTGELEKHYQPILERWGFEPYQVRSFLTDLMETGKAVFRASW